MVSQRQDNPDGLSAWGRDRTWQVNAEASQREMINGWPTIKKEMGKQSDCAPLKMAVSIGKLNENDDKPMDFEIPYALFMIKISMYRPSDATR